MPKLTDEEKFERAWFRRFYKPNMGGYDWIKPSPDEIEDFCKEQIKSLLAETQTALRKERKERREAEEAAVFHHKAQDKLHLRITALQSVLLDHQYRFTWTVDDGDIVICIECLAHTRIKFDENLNDIVKRIKCKPDCKIASTLEPSDPDHDAYITARNLKKEEQ